MLIKGDVTVATANPSEIKEYIDARTIQRLVTRISDGSLSISASEVRFLVPMKTLGPSCDPANVFLFASPSGS